MLFHFCFNSEAGTIAIANLQMRLMGYDLTDSTARFKQTYHVQSSQAEAVLPPTPFCGTLTTRREAEGPAEWGGMANDLVLASVLGISGSSVPCS